MKTVIIALAASVISVGVFAASHAEKGAMAKPAASAPMAKADAGSRPGRLEPDEEGCRGRQEDQEVGVGTRLSASRPVKSPASAGLFLAGRPGGRQPRRWLPVGRRAGRGEVSVAGWVLPWPNGLRRSIRWRLRSSQVSGPSSVQLATQPSISLRSSRR